MDVADARLFPERDVERAVVERAVAIGFVKAEHDIEFVGLRRRGFGQLLQPFEYVGRWKRDVAHAALDEITGQRGFRKNDDAGEPSAACRERFKSVAD